MRRLALTYALLLGEREISVTSLRAALALWRYCEQTTRWIFGTPFNHPDADRIYEALRKHPVGMTRTEISAKVFSNHANGHRLEEAFGILQKSGAVYVERQKTAGADREVWKLTSMAK